MSVKKRENYLDNKEFLQALIEFKKEVNYAKENSLNRPRVTEYLGTCFYKIATHLSYKPNFINYMYKDDMICDGIENCLQYIDNFDPEKSKNPFAYFTTIIYYAFLRRIAKEKRQMEIRSKILDKIGFDDVFYSDDAEKVSDMNYIKSRVQSSLKNV
jgi:DNA-directed RNA polymerase specialized sigma24 family protein